MKIKPSSEQALGPFLTPTEDKLTARIEELEAKIAFEQDRARRAEDQVFDLTAKLAKAVKALTRLRDCDWTITLPDRMDGVRDIARAALKELKDKTDG